ncbi:MAG TPA: hypothetical protein VET83_04595 [Candidatus Dormibacteraeota bacterium]|nr:hypothetical protein [Candidatus Dormibacteraeota bacterium]
MRVREPIVALVLTFMVPWSARAQGVSPTAPPPAISSAAQDIAMADSADVPQNAPPAGAQTAPEGSPLPPPAIPVPQTEPDFPRGRISGYMFGDAYYNVSGDPTHTYSGSGVDAGKINIDGNGPITKDLNGIQLRRVYFQLDNDLSVKFSTRFRLEADSKELTSGGKIGVFVKAAYLQVKNIVPRTNFFFGETPTPTFENSEEYWQYRAVEKTIVDFRGLSPASDLALELKGFVDGGHKVGYSAMLGDGTGQKPETNRYKRYYLSLPLNPIPDLKIEPYVDYEPGVNGADKALYKIFAGYEFKKFGVGGEAFRQVVHSRVAANTESAGYSIFARMAPAPSLGGYIRYDIWQPNKRAPNRVDTDLYIAGLDWQPYKDIHVMPNVEATKYRAKGTATAPSDNDLQARLTFYYRFSKP